MLTFFERNIYEKKAPKKSEIEDFKNNNPSLFSDVPWVKIKMFVYNNYRFL